MFRSSWLITSCFLFLTLLLPAHWATWIHAPRKHDRGIYHRFTQYIFDLYHLCICTEHTSSCYCRWLIDKDPESSFKWGYYMHLLCYIVTIQKYTCTSHNNKEVNMCSILQSTHCRMIIKRLVKDLKQKIHNKQKYNKNNNKNSYGSMWVKMKNKSKKYWLVIRRVLANLLVNLMYHLNGEETGTWRTNHIEYKTNKAYKHNKGSWGDAANNSFHYLSKC